MPDTSCQSEITAQGDRRSWFATFVLYQWTASAAGADSVCTFNQTSCSFHTTVAVGQKKKVFTDPISIVQITGYLKESRREREQTEKSGLQLP